MARKIKNKKQTKDNTLNQEIFGVITCFCSVFLAYGVFSRGHLGTWGNAIVDFFFGLLGNVVYIFPVFLLIFGIQYITKSTKKRKRFFRFSVLFSTFAVGSTLYFELLYLVIFIITLL